MGYVPDVLNSLPIKALEELLHARRREAVCLLLLLASASCVPAAATRAPPAAGAMPASAAGIAPVAEAIAPPEPEPMLLQPVSPTDAAAINAAIPLAAGDNPRAASIAFAGAAPIDRLRSLQCLAEAVYYEARSESEDGQRAVAQVVLNRVRHPAYPGSVCGVVYQGPLRAGGGCQFTFTCDGSLALAPAGASWFAARRIAAEALAGSVYAPVGLATHYHTQQVVPVWAYRLAKATVIGNHIFYRTPGAWGAPAAFSQHYAGREPSPATIIATRLPISLGRTAAAPALPTFAETSLPLSGGQAAAPEPPVDNQRLPVSAVRAEYATSGRWLDEAGAR
jgi:spore germination cell wall hydrolase CwlJ-like protein